MKAALHYVSPRVEDRDRILQRLFATKPGSEKCGPLIDALSDANRGLVNLEVVAANMKDCVHVRLNGNRYVRWSSIEESGATLNLIINFCAEHRMTPKSVRLTRINGLPAEDIISFTEREHLNDRSNSRLGLPFRRRKPDPRTAKGRKSAVNQTDAGITIEDLLKHLGESAISND